MYNKFSFKVHVMSTCVTSQAVTKWHS